MEPYRTHTRRPTSVVVYRPIHPAAAMMGAFALIAFLVFSGPAFFKTMAATHLSCDRAAATCSVVSAVGPFASERSVPLGAIEGTKVNALRQKSGLGYELALRTTQGEVPVTRSSWDRTFRENQQRIVDRFLEDPEAPSLDLEGDQVEQVSLVFMAGVPVLGLLLALASLGHGRMEIDWGDQTVRLMQVRWPLPPKVRSFPLADVHAAKVMIRPPGFLNKQREAYTVDIQIAGEPESIALGGYNSFGPERQQQIAARINALLGER
jgi:hypothetical protein